MNSILAILEHEDSATRTLALMRAAAASFADHPFTAAAWLHDPHPLLLGASPAAAAWFSERLALYGALLLARDAAVARAFGKELDATPGKSNEGRKWL